MENPTKEEAIKELVINFWCDDKNWEDLKNFMYAAGIHNLNPQEGQGLYLAAIVLDELEKYLLKFYSYAEQANLVRIFYFCRDCYDVVMSEDDSIIDVFEYNYGENGQEYYQLSLDKIAEIEKNSPFFTEIPELRIEFSKSPCDCCKSNLHGERFFVVFKELSHGN